MATRLQMIQYAGNAVRIYDKPERTVSRIKWFDTAYVPERTCKNKMKDDDEYSFECSECLWDNLTTEDMPANEILFCPDCGAKVVE